MKEYAEKLKRLGACEESLDFALTCESVGLDALTALWQSGDWRWAYWLAARLLLKDPTDRVYEAARAAARYWTDDLDRDYDRLAAFDAVIPFAELIAALEARP